MKNKKTIDTFVDPLVTVRDKENLLKSPNKKIKINKPTNQPHKTQPHPKTIHTNLSHMATIFSPSALFSSTTTTTPPKPPLPPSHLTPPPSKPPLTTTLTATAAAIAIFTTTSSPSLADAYQTYYGTAASAANYGGYGGNSNKKDSAEYIYDVPDGWKERLVSKVEKGTNGTDSEFYNPKKKSEKEYLTYLAGFRQLAPKDTVLNNLALSDVDLQVRVCRK